VNKPILAVNLKNGVKIVKILLAENRTDIKEMGGFYQEIKRTKFSIYSSFRFGNVPLHGK